MNEKDKKLLKIFGGISLLAISGYFLFKKKDDSGAGNTDPTNNNNTTGNNTIFNASIVAENLYEAMKNFGTDENLIFSSLTNVNQNQFGQVVNHFGLRTYNTYSGNTLGWNKHPLKTWLKSELSENDYSTLRLKYPNYL